MNVIRNFINRHPFCVGWFCGGVAIIFVYEVLCR
jgi:hypothetical protein